VRSSGHSGASQSRPAPTQPLAGSSLQTDQLPVDLIEIRDCHCKSFEYCTPSICAHKKHTRVATPSCHVEAGTSHSNLDARLSLTPTSELGIQCICCRIPLTDSRPLIPVLESIDPSSTLKI
jgi:hypothetical protein